MRRDLDYQLADRARDAGCLFALHSDAHDAEALVYIDTAVRPDSPASARRAALDQNARPSHGSGSPCLMT
jgi:hypothetical protein